ncbi:alpha/beta hydrolase family protein [Parashewanella tropica]|uniref:alpha/beta hydrolase family protein n=1 Tax=Parashewanella tropica TaxID=2547970 RepID=UPI001059E424|nr:S9 family peptidase [Parashewanella tropica]
MKRSFIFFCSLLTSLTLFTLSTQAQIPKDINKQAEFFSKPYEYSDVKISPKGSYISIISNRKNIRQLAILDAKTFKPIYSARFSGDEEVGAYVWVSDKRVAMQKVYNRGWSEVPEYLGEIFAINADGHRATYLFGQKYKGRQSGNHNTAVHAIGYIQHPLANDDRHMLIKAYPIGSGNEGFMSRAKAQLYKVNVYTGSRKKITTAPIENASFVLNSQQQPIFVSGINSNNEVRYFQHIEQKWIDIDSITKQFKQFSILSTTNDNQHVLVEGQKDHDLQSIYKLNLSSGKAERIVSNKNVEPQKIWKDKHTNEVYAVEFEDGYPNYAFLDKDHPRTKRLKVLLQSLPGHQVHIVSETLDGNISILKAFNDRNPGTYYLYNQKENKLQNIAAQKPWIDPNDLADVKPVSFKSRDGLTIHGYITLPYGIEHKNLPLVVNPHGGPAARDYWEYNSQNQFLAQNGIATLQINFRGSSGYGQDHQQAGNLNWGTKVQHDIIDGVNYAIKQGWINKDKICIEGGSFGAYSALQSAVIEPDMFKCAIGIAGVYDLPLMKEEGDIPSVNFGDSFLEEVIGNDINRMKAMSPTYNVDKLKTKIMLVHGKKDERTPIEQYEAMEEALNKANYPFKKMIFKKEGHGLYNPENRALYYKEMLGFIKESLKL